MKKQTMMAAGLVLCASLVSLGGFKEQVKNLEPSSAEERIFQTLIKDSEYGKPFYLYSHAGRPYRCFISTEGLPIHCRGVEPGAETIEALKLLQSRKDLKP